MRTSTIKRVVVLLLFAAWGSWAVWRTPPAAAQQSAITRKVLLQHDLAIPGYVATMIAQEIAVGGREGKHKHPGMLVAYIQEGELTVEYEGKPSVTYKAGDTFYLEPGTIHEGINKGTTPMKALATFVSEKGAPLMTPVP
jgi:quercetin dioxygenase-like cupin family protein